MKFTIITTLVAFVISIGGITTGFVAYRDNWKNSTIAIIDIITLLALAVSLMGVLIILG